MASLLRTKSLKTLLLMVTSDLRGGNIIVVVRHVNDIVTRVTELFIFNSDC